MPPPKKSHPTPVAQVNRLSCISRFRDGQDLPLSTSTKQHGTEAQVDTGAFLRIPRGKATETMEEELSLNKDGWWRCNSNATQSQVCMVKISAWCSFYFFILQCYNGQYHTCVGGSNWYHFPTQICQSTRHSCWHSLPNKCQVQTYFPQSCLPFPCERSLWLCTEQILDLCRETNSSH